MDDNKRIAKNTFILYFRTAITMLMSLYTTRVILKQLGIVDNGVYNAIGGFVAMSNALVAPLSGATQRFITYAIGSKDNNRVRNVFSACVYIHILLAILAVVAIEVIGLWYLDCKINLPQGRMDAARFVFQTSVIILFSRIVTVPYTAAVVAHEKFGFYAWNAIVLSMLRLVLISFLSVLPNDKLISYSLMEMFAHVLLNMSFVWFCLKKLWGCELVKIKGNVIYKDILGFSGWNFLGTSSSVVYSQGSGLLLNYFYGVLLNSAMGVTQQVLNAVNSFVSNFMMAVNPQITKSYASKNYNRSNLLVFESSKLASYLLLIVTFPIAANIHYLLDLWLVEVPEYTDDFVLLAILSSFLTLFINPLNCLIFATGKIKTYQIICVCINLLSVVVLYVFFKLNFHPAVLYIVLILQAPLKVGILLCLAKKETNFPTGKYLLEVYGKSILFVIPIVLVVFLKGCLTYEISFWRFVAESILYVLCMLVLLFAFGMDKSERFKIIQFLRRKTGI